MACPCLSERARPRRSPRRSAASPASGRRGPALRLGLGADVGAVLVAVAGLLDLVVHQPGVSPLAASRLRRRVSAALRDASFRASGLLAKAALRATSLRSS